ncbi:MAG: hypothetical protein GAK32_02568 [Pseudomonas fluorescens]|nr:MAG: hypothetical protein GAK32_02568 [Pseudomonas fluorescens]
MSPQTFVLGHLLALAAALLGIASLAVLLAWAGSVFF